MKHLFSSLMLLTILFLSVQCTAQTPSHAKQTTEPPVCYTKADSISVLQIFNSSKNITNPAQATIAIANDLLGIPYVAGTLETNETEQLVINLRELDCTTFVENVTALSICIQNKTCTFGDFCKTLTRIRYRDGIIDQYPSRLHYFTEWLINNRDKKLITLISDSIGNAPYTPLVNFMSTHPDKYKALSNPEFVKEIARAENLISSQKLKFITKDHIEQVEEQIHDGDIIALATKINGLDISHVGIAIHYNQRLHMIHASSTLKKVVMTDKPLSDYLAGIQHNTGILVGRICPFRGDASK